MAIMKAAADTIRPKGRPKPTIDSVRSSQASERISSFRRTIHSRMPVKVTRSEEHTSELQSLMRISYALLCLKKPKKQTKQTIIELRTVCTRVMQVQLTL